LSIARFDEPTQSHRRWRHCPADKNCLGEVKPLKKKRTGTLDDFDRRETDVDTANSLATAKVTQSAIAKPTQQTKFSGTTRFTCKSVQSRKSLRSRPNSLKCHFSNQSLRGKCFGFTATAAQRRAAQNKRAELSASSTHTSATNCQHESTRANLAVKAIFANNQMRSKSNCTVDRKTALNEPIKSIIKRALMKPNGQFDKLNDVSETRSRHLFGRTSPGDQHTPGRAGCLRGQIEQPGASNVRPKRARRPIRGGAHGIANL